MSELVKASRKTLGILCEMPIYENREQINLHMSFGRVIDEFAKRFEKVVLCGPVRRGRPGASQDYILQSSGVRLLPQPNYGSSLSALLHPIGILQAYWRICKTADVIFVRGMLPYVFIFYFFARWFRRKPCHWIVGDPISLLKTHKRSSRLKDWLSLAYARQDRIFTRLGRRMSGGSFVCNGKQLADIYRSPRTSAVVSSTITQDEFFERKDTCQNAEIKLLFVGFVRPEKGLEYLIEALPQLGFDRPWRLTIVGPTDGYPDYKAKLDARIIELGMKNQIDWVGYVSYGPAMWEYLRSHDIFVLPTLSEGTPRVLVEARANSLPIVATNVGGGFQLLCEMDMMACWWNLGMPLHWQRPFRILQWIIF